MNLFSDTDRAARAAENRRLGEEEQQDWDDFIARITTEPMYTVVGVDISHFQQKTATDLHGAVKAGYPLIICKATQGLRMVDPAFKDFITRLAGVEDAMPGAYHFGDGSDPVQQAAHFLTIAGHLPLLSLDLETPPAGTSQMSIAQAEMFVRHMHAATGKWPLLYSGAFVKDNPPPVGSPLYNCELWLSQYGPKPVLPKGWKVWRLWQFTGDGIGPMPHDVAGIGTKLDINRFPGTLADCRRWYAGL